MDPIFHLDPTAFNRMVNYEFPPWTEPTMSSVGCAAGETDEGGEPTGRPCFRPPEFICSRVCLQIACTSFRLSYSLSAM